MGYGDSIEKGEEEEGNDYDDEAVLFFGEWSGVDAEKAILQAVSD